MLKSMLPKNLKKDLEKKAAQASHPRELVVDFMFTVQDHYGYLTDEAVAEVADMLDMAPMEVEELATFYTFTYREPVGKYVIHICDSVVCRLDGSKAIGEFLEEKLGINMGETTSDGLFTLLPVCCIGYCDRSPAILINKKAYGPLTIEKLDEIIENLKKEAVEA